MYCHSFCPLTFIHNFLASSQQCDIKVVTIFRFYPEFSANDSYESALHHESWKEVMVGHCSNNLLLRGLTLFWAVIYSDYFSPIFAKSYEKFTYIFYKHTNCKPVLECEPQEAETGRTHSGQLVSLESGLGGLASLPSRWGGIWWVLQIGVNWRSYQASSGHNNHNIKGCKENCF